MDEDVDDVAPYENHPCEDNDDGKMLIIGW
jgi:hypothetical protein